MSTPLIELKNVTKIFGGKKDFTVALEDMTFAVNENFQDRHHRRREW
mgnify:CR=1 FL=1